MTGFVQLFLQWLVILINSDSMSVSSLQRKERSVIGTTSGFIK